MLLGGGYPRPNGSVRSPEPPVKGTRIQFVVSRPNRVQDCIRPTNQKGKGGDGKCGSSLAGICDARKNESMDGRKEDRKKQEGNERRKNGIMKTGRCRMQAERPRTVQLGEGYQPWGGRYGRGNYAGGDPPDVKNKVIGPQFGSEL